MALIYKIVVHVSAEEPDTPGSEKILKAGLADSVSSALREVEGVLDVGACQIAKQRRYPISNKMNRRRW